MIYSYEDTIPINTPKASMRRTVMKLTPGIIHQVEIQFPIGCAGLAHCVIKDNITQIWPSSPNYDFSADGFVISFREDYEIKYEPWELYMNTWNTSTDYEHTITVRLGLLPTASFLNRLLPDMLKLYIGI